MNEFILIFQIPIRRSEQFITHIQAEYSCRNAQRSFFDTHRKGRSSSFDHQRPRIQNRYFKVYRLLINCTIASSYYHLSGNLLLTNVMTFRVVALQSAVLLKPINIYIRWAVQEGAHSDFSQDRNERISFGWDAHLARQQRKTWLTQHFSFFFLL